MTAKTKKGKRKPIKQWLAEFAPLYLMLLPMVVYFLIFNYVPMLGLQIAFKDWNMRLGVWGSDWATDAAGNLQLFKHFKSLFGDPLVMGKFWNTLRISSLRLVFGFPVPILMAVLLNEMTSTRVRKVLQTVSYLPYFISWVIIAGILFSITRTGSPLQNLFVKALGHIVPFFGDEQLFLVVVVVTDIWKNAGWGTVIYFAALTSIDMTLYEAAMVDGANRFQRMIHITLPGILPALSINLIFTVSGLVYGGFDQIYNLYNPLVYGTGDILETYIFRIGVTDGLYDVAAAMGLFNSALALLFTIGANYTVKALGGEGIW